MTLFQRRNGSLNIISNGTHGSHYIENLWQREEDALFNSQLWMTPCHGLSLETLHGIGAGENVEALIEEVGDYQGPTALLRDTANWLAEPDKREWRKAFRPVLDAAGWREGLG